MDFETAIMCSQGRPILGVKRQLQINFSSEFIETVKFGLRNLHSFEFYS